MFQCEAQRWELMEGTEGLPGSLGTILQASGPTFQHEAGSWPEALW